MSKARDKAKYKEKFEKLGLNIRNARKAKNYSQETLAFEVDSTRNYIGCIERAEKIPSLTIIFDVAEALGKSISDLFDDIK